MRVNLYGTWCVLALAASIAAAGPAWAQGEAPAEPSQPLWSHAPTVGHPVKYYTRGAELGDAYYRARVDQAGKPNGTTTTGEAPAAEACDESCCTSCCDDFCAACEDCPTHGLVLFAGFDSWRGIADRVSLLDRPSNNDGGSFGLNYGTRLGRVSDLTGIGFQLGASYGVYDWNGRPDNTGVLTTADAQQQVFVTAGFFKKANDRSALSYGVVHDWMCNQAFGAYATNPTLGQFRAQVAYATSAVNEFGAWGTWRDKGSTTLDSTQTPVSFRSINQINFFWHHKWECSADSWLWVGVPQNSRLDPIEGGNLGDLLLGGSVIAPITDVVALYANMQYMHPSSSSGDAAYGEAAWYVAFGLQFYLGGNARTRTVAGNCWLPYMPLANNGNFLVDAAR